jgi:hypothetical protein
MSNRSKANQHHCPGGWLWHGGTERQALKCCWQQEIVSSDGGKLSIDNEAPIIALRTTLKKAHVSIGGRGQCDEVDATLVTNARGRRRTTDEKLGSDRSGDAVY